MLSPRCGKISACTHNKEVEISTRMLVEGCHFSPAVVRAFKHIFELLLNGENVAGGPKLSRASAAVL